MIQHDKYEYIKDLNAETNCVIQNLDKTLTLFFQPNLNLNHY